MKSEPKARHMRILERAFTAEVNRAVHGTSFQKSMPLQLGNSKPVRECVGLGYLEVVSAKHSTALGAMTISGYEMTRLGRALYCMEAA